MKNKKKLWVIIVAAILLLIGIAVLLGRTLGKQETFLVTLNERDVTLEIGETKQLQILPIDEEDKLPKYKTEWKSSNPQVATVDDDGLVTAIAAGETRITVLITTGEKEYSASCVITIFGDEDEQATYTIKYFVQDKDRSGYQVTEESHTRLIGSEVVIEESYALSKAPSKNYVFNEAKSNLKGTVKKNIGLTLELYYDVAEITYTVNAYYETVDAGMYLKETQTHTAYAFTEVTAPDLIKTGYALKKNAAGTVTSIKEVQAGSRLAVYYDRIKTNVTITYISGKPTVTYQCVYGVGLKDAPASVFEDTFEPYCVAPYANGEKIADVQNFLKRVTKDTTIEYKVDAEGFEYNSANGGTLKNKTTKARTAAYTYFNGKDSTIYLEAVYNLTGYTDNLFGIELKSGNTTREIRFSGFGVSVMKDHTQESGVLGQKADAFTYPSATKAEYVWAQNMKGNNHSERNSVIHTMTSSYDAGKHKVVWAVWEGTLYAQVDGQMCVRLPLSLLDESWTAEAEYEIAFSTWDKYSYGDGLSITNIKADFGYDAECKLALDKQVTAGTTKNVNFEPITGSYIPSCYDGASYIYSEPTDEAVAVSAEISAYDITNTVSNVGISVMVNNDIEQSVQLLVENNSRARYTTRHVFGSRVDFPEWALLQYEKPYNENGICEIVGVVKDSTLYVKFNGVQVYALPLESILHDYGQGDKISIGIAANDATLGLYQYHDLTFMSGEAASEISTDVWNTAVVSHDGSQCDTPLIDAKTSKVTIPTNGDRGASSAVKFVGTNTTWEIAGTASSDAAVLMKHGIRIECGSRKIYVHPKWFNETDGGGIWYRSSATGGWTESKSKALKFKDITGIFNDGTAGNDNNVAGIQENVYKSFAEKSQTKVNFKYQLVNDFLYAWFCADSVDMDSYATADNYAWKIDLTDSKIAGFAAGSNYSVSLFVTNSAAGKTGNSITENLKVKYGSKVDTTLIENIEAKYWFYSLNYDTVSNQAVNERRTHASPTQSAIIYYPGKSDIVWTSADVTYTKVAETDQKTPVFGVTVASSDGKDAQICLYVREDNAGGIELFNGHLQGQHENFRYYKTAGHYADGVDVFADCTVTGASGSYAYTLKKPNTGAKWNIKAAVYNNVLYITLDDVLLYAIPMTALYKEWTEGNEYSLGYVNYGRGNGYMDLSNMQVCYGEVAEAKFILPSDIQKTQTSHLMTYNILDGTYVPSNASGYAYAYGQKFAQTETIAMQTTITERTTTSGTITAGVAVKLGDSYRYILNNEDGYGEISITKVNPLKLTAVLKDSTLYIWNEGSNKPIYEAKLKDMFGADYSKDADMQLGFVTKDSNAVADIFKDVKFYMGQDAENVYTAVKNGTKMPVALLSDMVRKLVQNIQG